MMYSVDYLEELVNKEIETVSLNEQPRSLFNPVRYILSLGGKRLRPILTLISANMFGDDITVAVKPALAVEIFHNFSLLHDDLMDCSDMRRGNPTVHKKWNDNTAILSGDAMLIESYKYISSVSPEMLPEVISLFTTTAMDVCKGQQYDMDFEERLDVTEEEYLEMIRLKTAVLLGCALKIGAILAKAPLKDANLLYDFGINIGLAFQLKDDLLDVYGDPKVFGKNIGGDIVNNKKTYLLIKALQHAEGSKKEELEYWMSLAKFDSDKKIEAVKNIYDGLNLKSISENLIEKYYLSASQSLAAVEVAEDRKKELTLLAKKLMHRER